MPIHLEIACFNIQSAQYAARNGADRIELCADPSVGGITPPLSWLDALRKDSTITVPINIMIRPRGGDFIYTETEVDIMLTSLDHFRAAGADGFVFGCLTSANLINTSQTRTLLERAKGNPCTFHRAFDSVPPAAMASQLRELEELGVKSILTSGGTDVSERRRRVLKDLVRRGEGIEIEIIAGGGVRSVNVRELVEGTGVRWVHSSAITSASEDEETASVVEIRALKTAIVDFPTRSSV